MDTQFNSWEKHYSKKGVINRLVYKDTTYDDVVEILLKLTTDKSKCMEVGCGSGSYALKLISKGRNCIASDYSMAALEIVKKRGKHYTI